MLERLNTTFRDSVLGGLSQHPKTLEPKWFYDAVGSALFDQICLLPEYYPTRTETAILRERADDIAEALGAGVVLYEPGAGSLSKARIVLEALEAPSRFVPTDISSTHLHEAAEDVREAFPDLAIEPIACDFTKHLAIPPSVEDDMPVTLFFPGSTIGNFEPGEAEALLRRFREESGAQHLLIGVDLVKDRNTLVAAYDDAAGVTAAFNLNLLERINRELGGDFVIEKFQHVALFNEEKSRIEMHLESLEDQEASIAGSSIQFTAGERLHTENSYKYSPDRFSTMAARAGWNESLVWTDDKNWFGVFLFTAAA
ncbi:L-histidine N(alpha)-methyltransferase [Notoacmeibacter sp. MSK16QG-6]|uniref:L-histidine N(alpha)-methyltransferase n=1 Tax=Notoacmeibacter sp. MSK16QG-6 TaxID=2957982 RepID=UPI00209EF291|nr:L-histidine N(alpha)-methyltransferase [Notoacmeibacter sp. MSK16QG-6]MCP1198418.1 L-histidine N(alpha)-methyltransferase [Notoacmeibacter sp. MSK16QG-6]